MPDHVCLPSLLLLLVVVLLNKRCLLLVCVFKIQIAESWSYSPLNDTAEAASQVIAALAQRGWTIPA